MSKFAIMDRNKSGSLDYSAFWRPRVNARDGIEVDGGNTLVLKIPTLSLWHWMFRRNPTQGEKNILRCAHYWQQSKELWKHNQIHLEQGSFLEKEMATHSSILAWKIPWTEEPGGLPSMGSQRVSHDWAHQHRVVSLLNHWNTPSWLLNGCCSQQPQLLHPSPGITGFPGSSN